MTIVAPSAALFTAAAIVRRGAERVPAAASEPVVETKSAPSGTAYEAVPTGMEPASVADCDPPPVGVATGVGCGVGEPVGVGLAEGDELGVADGLEVGVGVGVADVGAVTVTLSQRTVFEPDELDW